MLKRIPVSLKFDDETESEFYYELIEQKRIDRELSNLICDLLHVYYENEDVRTTVDNYQNEKNPYLLIQADLKRIALEHSKNMMSATMLNDYTENEKKNLEKGTRTTEKENNSEPTREEIVGLVERTPVVLEDIKEKFDLIDKSEVSKYVSSFVDKDEGVIEEPIESTIKEVEVKIEQPIEPTIKEKEVEVKVEQPKMPILEKPKAKKQKAESEDKEDKEDKEVKEEEKPKIKKPASFGKLMKSMENND